jgi:hypothetical protein
MLAYRTSQKSNSIAGILGLYLYARRASPRIISTLSNMGLSVSPKTVERGVENLRRNALDLAKVVATDPETPFMTVHDNLQFYLNVGETRLGNFAHLLHTTTSFVVPMHNTKPSTLSMDPQAPPGLGTQGVLSWSDVRISPEETSLMDTIFTYHIASILVEFSGVSYFKSMRRQVQEKLPEIHKISLHRSKIYPLSAMPLNEASQRGNREVLDNIFHKQLKISEEKVRLRSPA